MGLFYKAYKNAWGEGDPILIHVPSFTEGHSRVSGQTIISATANYGSWFDHTYTLFADTQAHANDVLAVGFTDVHFADGTQYWMTETKYFQFTGKKVEYYNNGAALSHTFSSTVTTILGYNEIPNNAPSMDLTSIKVSDSTFSVGGFLNTSVSARVYEFYQGIEPFLPPKDPYVPGGTTGTGGGTGNFDGTGDDISIPSLPTLSAVNAGFITLFNPTLAQMNALSSYMWSGLFDLDGWRKIFADPMDAILGLSIVPVAVPNGGAKEVKVGNISTGVSMTTAASQYVTVDCGTLNVQEYWGAYLDYDPYTKAEIYLPYIGTHPVAVDDIMGKPVHVVYHVDILSGACCAYVQCGGSVLYTFAGQCSSSIPITGDNWTRVVNGALSIAGAIGGMVASGGMTAPMAVSAVASNAVNSSKPSVEKSGSMGGTGGMLGVQTPYLILTRPRQAIPEKLNEFTGYPSYITTVLADCNGYTEIESVHLENIPATGAELDEIETLLKGGVIF